MTSSNPKKLLLHACCGPCAIYPLQQLLEQEIETTLFFYNPNIHPFTEYIKRRQGLEEVAKKFDVPILYAQDEYNPSLYFQAIHKQEDNRCTHCYSIRLQQTASTAMSGNFDGFTTTLLYSKYQNHEQLKSLCTDLSSDKSMFYYQDFRTGWKRGITQSKAWSIYRQQYCGCLYSEHERYKDQLQT